jgi:hypothetical protein
MVNYRRRVEHGPCWNSPPIPAHLACFFVLLYLHSVFSLSSLYFFPWLILATYLDFHWIHFYILSCRCHVGIVVPSPVVLAISTIGVLLSHTHKKIMFVPNGQFLSLDVLYFFLDSSCFLWNSKPLRDKLFDFQRELIVEVVERLLLHIEDLGALGKKIC